MARDDAPEYEHTQTGHLVIGVATAASLVCLAPLIFLNPEDGRWALWATLLVVVAVGVLFHSLTVRVADGTITWYFGPHFWTNELAVCEIEGVEKVRNEMDDGWGIHRIADGWLYNVSGFDAVEVETQDGMVVRLGTDEPERLRQVLDAHCSG